jgi:hypothetical protein
MPATQILVVGTPGSGKSSAWDKVNPLETVVITPNAKPLPWEGSAKNYIPGKNRIQTDKLVDVPGVLRLINKDKPEIKNILIEDLTHYLSARTLSSEFMARKVGNEAFARWNEFAADVAAVIKAGDAPDFREDLNIVYNGHTELDDSGQVVLQTSGKLLDRDFKIQSYFTYALHALAKKVGDDIQYKFLTNKDGIHEAKTPRGCFKEKLIDNDMAAVIKRIREYQGN